MVERRHEGAQPLLGSELDNSGSMAYQGPFTLLSSLILGDVKGLAIPGTIVTLRHHSMYLSAIALILSVYELLRYSLQFGPLPEGESYVLMWVLILVGGGLINTLGAFMLHKGLILAGALLFCCVMAPATPNMIVLSQGDEYLYFLFTTLFFFAAGTLQVFLYCHLSEELSAREYLSGQPAQLGNLAPVVTQADFGPCGC